VNISSTKNSSQTHQSESDTPAGLPFNAPTAFEHITLNTGHSCPQGRDSVSADVAEMMAKLIQAGLERGGWTNLDFDGAAWPVHVEVIESTLLAGIFLPSADVRREKPVAAIGVSVKPFAGVKVWDRLRAHASALDASASALLPSTPWIAALLDTSTPASVGSVKDLAAFFSLMGWLGDFERCLAWGFVRLLEAAPMSCNGESLLPAQHDATHHPGPSSVDKFDIVSIGNRGQAIASTNYWDCQAAEDGIFYLSWNAGAARLLVPDCQKHHVREMRSAKHVVISRGPMPQHGGPIGLELLFEDNSDQPFVLMIPEDASDRRLPNSDQATAFCITVWTRGGQKLRLPCRFREVDGLPCLKAWASH
jgi:hypothetical protein